MDVRPTCAVLHDACACTRDMPGWVLSEPITAGTSCYPVLASSSSGLADSAVGQERHLKVPEPSLPEGHRVSRANLNNSSWLLESAS